MEISTCHNRKEKRYVVSKPNYYKTKFFTENVLAIQMKKTKVLVNKLVYLGLSILDLSKTVMHEFWHDYVKPTFGENENLCYMNTDSVIVHVKQVIFTKILQKMLKQDLMPQISK